MIEVEPILSSDSVIRLYKALCRKYPHVNPTQRPSVFLNEAVLFPQLKPDERKIFSDIFFSFVCADENGMAKLAIHYDGDRKFGNINKAQRELQRKLCAMAGIEFWRIKTDDQLREICSSLQHEDA